MTKALTSGIVDISVVFSSLKVTQGGGAPGRVRHDSHASVDLTLLPELSKDPPDTLHESGVEGLVTSVKVDPSSHSLDGRLPLSRVSHDNLPTRRVVLVDTHGHDIFLALDVESLVDLVLDGQTVGVPTEPSLDVETRRGCMSRDNVLCVNKWGDGVPAIARAHLDGTS